MKFIEFESRNGDALFICESEIVAVGKNKEGNLWVHTKSGLISPDCVTYEVKYDPAIVDLLEKNQ